MTVSKYFRFAKWLLLALAVTTALPARAEDGGGSWADDLQIHGFLTQSFVKTDHNRFFGDSPSGSFEFTELGINASFRPLPAMLVSGQLLSRNAGDMYDASPQVDYALVDWTLSNADDYVAGISLGRQKNPIGLFNETRDVASTRPGVFMPQSVYFDKVRNLMLASDGIGAYADWFTDTGVWHAKALYGVMLIDTNVEVAYLGGMDFPGEMEADGPSWLAQISYEDTAGHWHLAASGVHSVMKFEPGLGSPLHQGSTEFYYWVLSAQYSGENWSLTGEYAWEPLTWRDFGPNFPERELTGVGWYVQANYDLRTDLSLMLRYESALADKDDPDGTKASAASRGRLPPHALYSHNWVAGLRWDLTPQLMLRAEYQYNTGTHILSGRENPDPSTLQEHWHLFSILASYRF